MNTNRQVDMEGTLKISDAATIAMHAMAYLASCGGKGPVSAHEMARYLGVSEAHLGKVLQRLARFGFVSSRRGPRGGFEAGRRPEEVTLLEIYEAVDGPMSGSTCLLGHDACPGRSGCILGDLMSAINARVHDQLSRTTLSDLDLGPCAPKRTRNRKGEVQ